MRLGSSNALQLKLAFLQVYIIEQALHEVGTVPLTVVGRPAPSATMEMHYFFDTGRYPHGVAHIAQRFEAIIIGLISSEIDPEVSVVSQIPLCDPSERSKLLVEWNSTDETFPTAATPELIAQMAKTTPDAVALVAFDDEQVTYAELDRRAGQLASFLAKVGVLHNQVVAVCMDRSVELLVSMLAIFKVGATYLPVDPAYPDARKSFILSDSKAQLLMTKSGIQLLTSSTDAALPLTIVSLTNLQLAPLAPMATPANSNKLPAYMTYTSGSTGTPKGVLLGHEGLTARLSWLRNYLPFDSLDSFLCTISIAFDPAMYELLTPLIVGGKVVLAHTDKAADAEYLANLIETSQGTSINFVPTLLSVFMQRSKDSHLQCLRHVICGGEPLPPAIRDTLVSLGWGNLFNAYGPTEVTQISTMHRCQTNEEEDLSHASLPIGKPVGNLKAYLCNKHMQTVPVGVAGELFLSGVGLAHSYLGRPSLTADRFIPNPFGDGSRYYRTGDLCVYDKHGHLTFLGRVDRQVKVRGYRIELGEVESAVLAYPNIKEVAVVVKSLSGTKQLVCYFAPTTVSTSASSATTEDSQGSASLIRELKEHMKSSVPSYMVPAYFVYFAALPRSRNGKVDFDALPIPTATRDETTDYVAPRSAIESKLVNIWKEVRLPQFLLQIPFSLRTNSTLDFERS